MRRRKCVIILSEKSSGSSALQRLLTRFPEIRHIATTRHYANETLFWTKAASVLEMPQFRMADSEVPLAPRKARSDLIALLNDNLVDYTPPNDDRELIFGGWKRLCRQYRPVFLEKSPHHLGQTSALKLIAECIEYDVETDYLLIGLIRNPMATLYSQFTRWRTRPEELQSQWLRAYQNLRRLKELAGERLIIVRYEDMVSSLQHLRDVFDFCGVGIENADESYLHRDSIAKWKRDGSFGFVLSEEVMVLAERFGYQKEDLSNASRILWPARREFSRALFKSKSLARRSLKRLLKLRTT